MEASSLQVRYDLGAMDRCQGFDGLELEDEALVDKEIKSCQADLSSFVKNVDFSLPLEWNATQRQFHLQGFFIDAFEVSWSQVTVYFNGSTNYRMGEVI